MKYHKILCTLLVAIFVACDYDDADEIELVKLGAETDTYEISAEGETFEISLYANGSYHVELTKDVDWLSYALGEPEDGKAIINAECTYNEDFKRSTGLVICSDVDDRRDTLYIKQKAFKEAYLTFDDASITVAGAGGQTVMDISTNVSFDDMTVEITYTDEDNADWVSNLVIMGSSEQILIVETEANPDEVAPRSASVDISFTDGWDETVSVEFNLLQRTALEAVGKEISFEDFRDSYAMNSTIDEYLLLEGIVVSNTDGQNAGENTQETTSTIDYTPSYCTVYLESEDGQYGIEVVTDSEDDNVFEQYDHVQLLIYGCTGTFTEDPDRYGLEGVTKAMVVSRTSGSSSDVPVKQKYITDLTDDDIYTYVTLLDVEFPVRKGELTPINEGYTIATGASRMTKYPLLFRDINGDSMYLYTNTNCTYRRDGTRLPYGSGSISGVVVHERFPRFEWKNGADPADIEDDPELGYIGRYQLRHQTKDDVWGNMNDSVEDSFSTLLTEYRYWNPDVTNMVQKPTYGTNGWFTHTYSTEYTGSETKNYTFSTYKQHMWGGMEYTYLGPCGNSASYMYGANYGNKNGIGIVLDISKESWYSAMDALVSYNPDGTIEWCGPYAESDYAACGTSGWLGNDAISTSSKQINYTGSTSLRGKGQSSGYAYCAFANHFWWDDDTDRFYSWLFNFSTEGISTDHISMQIAVFNSQQTFYCPRYWAAEWALTDSQDEADDDQWTLIGEYTVPDVSVWSNTLYSSIVAYKYIDFELPLEILGQPNVYIRLHPTSDLCSSGTDYADAVLSDSASGLALASEHASCIGYFAIRYNK